ncbi:MAG TPA: hypothetical protein VFK05_18470 [Polyangiaceae bacterium]|nr:hypothetical protein [Polyangiaceae bacterium]
MTNVSIVSKNALTEEDVITLVATEWEEMRLGRAGGAGDATDALLALGPEGVFEIKKVPPDTMGFALTAGAAFAVAVKFAAAHGPALAAKFGDAVVAAAARELFLEALKRIRGKRGHDFVKESGSNKPSANTKHGQKG